MKGYSLDEAMKRPCSTLCKVRTESITPNILHLVFVRERWNSACWVFSKQGFVEVKEISKSATNSKLGFLKRLEVGLNTSQIREIIGTLYS